jgi:putative PEP-CTERM system TPR-repeat lipoprotein
MNPKSSCLALLLALSLSACGDNPEKMVASARDYIAKGDSNAAIIQLKNALQKKPDLAEARFLFGSLLLEGGDPAGAEREFRKALEKGFPIDQIAVPLSNAMVSMGKAKDLVTEFAEFKSASPDAVAAVSTGMANAYLALRDKAKAEASVRAALAAQPNYPPAKLVEARMKVIAGDLPGALAMLDELAKANESRYDALMLRADIYVIQDKTDLALADLNAAAQLRSQAVPPRLRAAQILLSLRKLDEAEAKLAEARKISPGNIFVRFATGTLALQRGKYDAARDAAQQVLRVAPDFLPASLMAGTAQLRLRDFLQAQENLEKVVNKAPGNVAARRLLARAYVGSGDSAKALDLLEPLVSLNPPDYEALMIAGEAALHVGDQKRSAEYFDRATKMNPNDARARARLGVARLAGGDSERAIEDLETASTIDGANSGADVTLVMLHLQRREFDKAKEIAEAYVKKEPNQAFAHNLLGGVLASSGDEKGAVAAFNKALSLNPAFLPATINLANFDMKNGQRDAAIKRFDKVIEQNPKNPEGYLAYARFLGQTRGAPEEIRKVLDKGITANPAVSSLRLAELELLLRTGDKKGALAVAQNLIAAFPQEMPVLMMASKAQAGAGDIQQAIATMEKAVSLKPDLIQPLLGLADLQRSAKNSGKAEDALRRALKISPNSPEAKQRLFVLKLEQGKTADAIDLARDQQQLKPNDPLGYEMEGEAQFVAKNLNASIASYTKAFELSQQPAQLVKLYRVLLASGKKAEADALLARWFKENPRDQRVRTYLAELALAAKVYPDAFKQYQVLSELDPKNPMYLNNLAWVAGQLKDPKAMSYVEQALALAPDSPPLLDTKGNLQIDAGQVAQGIATLKKAVSLAPDRGELRLSLARALAKSGDKSAAKTEINTVLKTAPEGSPLRSNAENLLKTL